MPRVSSLSSPIPERYPDGFGCKLWIAYQLGKNYLGGLYDVWFAGELNPLGNGDSSNPLEIHATVDRAVRSHPWTWPRYC